MFYTANVVARYFFMSFGTGSFSVKLQWAFCERIKPAWNETVIYQPAMVFQSDDALSF